MSLLLLLRNQYTGGVGGTARIFFAEVWARLWGAELAQREWSATEIMIYADPKPSGAEEDFQIDWTLVIGGDVITASTWDVPAGLTLVGSANTTLTATARLGGGVPGAKYVVTNLVALVSGQLKAQQLLVPVT
jgi:hypothetical protein